MKSTSEKRDIWTRIVTKPCADYGHVVSIVISFGTEVQLGYQFYCTESERDFVKCYTVKEKAVFQ